MFDLRDHPLNLYDGPLLLLVIQPYIGNYKVRRTLINSGSELNILFANTYDNLALPRKALILVKEPFYGIMPGMSAYPLGRIDLQVTLQEGENLRSKILTFEVADFESAYNCILGRPFLKKFMVVVHFAYSVLKVSAPRGPLTIWGDHMGTMACDMKTLDMIRQYRQAPVDPLQPAIKQQKTAPATLASATPKAKAAPKDPSSSKAAKAKDSVKPILVASEEEKQAQTTTENEDNTKDQFRDTATIP